MRRLPSCWPTTCETRHSVVTTHTDHQGIAFVCGANGAVLRVIRDELELPDLFGVGRTLTELVTA